MGPLQHTFIQQTNQAGQITPSKRKTTERKADVNRTPKKPDNRKKSEPLATVNLNPSGFYEIQIEEEHVAALAKGCGVETTNVIKAMQTDYAESEAQAAVAVSLNTPYESTWDERFQLDPEDDMALDDIDSDEIATFDFSEDPLNEDEI